MQKTNISLNFCQFIELIDEYYCLFIMDNYTKKTQIQKLSIYKKYIKLSIELGNFEAKIVDFFDLYFLKDDNLWYFLITNQEQCKTKNKLLNIRPKILYAINNLPKIIKLLDSFGCESSYNISQETNSEKYERVTFFVYKNQQNRISEKLLLMLQAVENLYNSTSTVEGESNIKIEFVTYDFKSSTLIE